MARCRGEPARRRESSRSTTVPLPLSSAAGVSGAESRCASMQISRGPPGRIPMTSRVSLGYRRASTVHEARRPSSFDEPEARLEADGHHRHPPQGRLAHELRRGGRVAGVDHRHERGAGSLGLQREGVEARGEGLEVAVDGDRLALQSPETGVRDVGLAQHELARGRSRGRVHVPDRGQAPAVDAQVRRAEVPPLAGHRVAENGEPVLPEDTLDVAGRFVVAAGADHPGADAGADDREVLRQPARRAGPFGAVRGGRGAGADGMRFTRWFRAGRGSPRRGASRPPRSARSPRR